MKIPAKSTSLIAIAVIFVTWSVLDFLIHGVILGEQYQATASMWRPMEEMKMGLMYGVVLIAAAVFVLIYDRFISDKSVTTGILFGLLYGIGVGAGMGLGTYSVTPIPLSMAWVWFLGTVVETTVAGGLVGLIVKE